MTQADVHVNAARDQEIVALHRSGLTLQELGDRFGLSRERVRQIVRRAGPSPRRRPVAGQAPPGERVRLRIGNLSSWPLC